MIKVSVISPVLNECPWIGYSVLSALPYVHEFVYSLDTASNDGTRELLQHIKSKYAYEKLTIIDHPTFHPHDTEAYDEAFNVCIRKATGDACFFLHADMVVTKWNELPKDALAWWTQITSFAGDFSTVITKGRSTQWKNIHKKEFGLSYRGAYGSQNEDFYHSEITGNSLKHYGEDFKKYPYAIANSGILINHYCELKPYKRRLEKMKLCLKTQAPNASAEAIEETATQHPRVTLASIGQRFGVFEFTPGVGQMPEIIKKHKEEFESFTKEEELVYG